MTLKHKAESLEEKAQRLAVLFGRASSSQKQLRDLLLDILTPAEVDDLNLRWKLLKMLHDGATQREVAKDLGISISKVSRGARVLQFGSQALKSVLEATKI